MISTALTVHVHIQVVRGMREKVPLDQAESVEYVVDKVSRHAEVNI